MGTTSAIYARVSTREQNVDGQLLELREFARARGFEIFEEYVDHGLSGASDNRPAMNKLMRDALRRRFDVVVVSSFDRFGRSLKFLVNTLEEFHALGIDFVSVRQQIDTTTPAGKMTFGVISAMAEFERAMISERVREGMKRAKERGRRLGRPSLDRELVQRVLELRSQDMSYGQIAAEVERSRASVAGIVRRELSRKGKERDTLEPLENKPLEVRK